MEQRRSRRASHRNGFDMAPALSRTAEARGFYTGGSQAKERFRAPPERLSHLPWKT
jgi:hypothetical protein